VGTVWIGCTLRDVVTTRSFLFPGSRQEIRARAAQAALFLVYRRIQAAARPVTSP
jgi:nicotinamide mononucleotide (NMN) deamidase PncC